MKNLSLVFSSILLLCSTLFGSVTSSTPTQQVLNLSTSPATTSASSWDANLNLSANNFLSSYTTTATAAATTTLTVSSTALQYFTGSTTQTVTMPVVSSLVLGQQYRIVNLSSGAVTVQSSGTNTIQVMAANTQLILTTIAITGTTATSWNASYSYINAIASPTFTGTVTAPNLTLSNISTGTNADFLCLSSGGVVLLQSSACTISSRRFKENINPLGDKDGLNEVMKLRPVQFNMKPQKKKNADINYLRTQTGLIAEDVALVDPRLAVYEKDGVTPKSYRQEAVISILVKAIQEQQGQIESLKKQIDEVALPLDRE